MIGEYIPTTSSYYYYASDQINSTRLVTDATSAVVHSAQYDPYGGLYKTWIDTWHPKPGFSGKEREFGSEMDYFGARYYGHKQYRFLSVDPVIGKDEALTNPQLWNLYSYCRNNPITFFDPDGKDAMLFGEIRINSFLKMLPYVSVACEVYKAAGGPTTSRTRIERVAWLFSDGSYQMFPATPWNKDKTNISSPGGDNAIASVHNHPDNVVDPKPSPIDRDVVDRIGFHQGKPMMTVSNKGIWVYDSTRPEGSRTYQAVKEDDFRKFNKVYQESKK